MKIKTRGRPIVRPPFMIKDAVYTLSGETLISSLLAMGIDIYTLVYEPAGYSVAKFNDVVKEDPTITSFISTEAETVYVPTDYLLTIDDDFYPYSEKAVLASIGPIHNADNLEDLVASIKTVIKHQVGVKADVSIEDISEVIALPAEEHGQIVKIRSDLKVGKGSVEQELIETKDHNILLSAQVRSLLEFIKHYLATCCDSKVCLDIGDGDDKMIYYRYPLNHYVLVDSSQPFMGSVNCWEDHLRRWTPPDFI